MTKTYEFRPLLAKDTFKVLNLVNAMNILEPLKEIFGSRKEEIIEMVKEESEEGLTQKGMAESVGFEMMAEVISIVVQNVPRAESEINSFLADLTEMKTKDIENLPISEYFGMIKDFFNHPDLKQLFESVQSLMQ